MIVIKNIFFSNKKALFYCSFIIGVLLILPSYFICSNIVLADEANRETPLISETIFIDIKGAVKNPGVYEISEGKRVIDAVYLAGGFTSDADTTNTNLAKKLSDEMIVRINKYIPKVIKTNKVCNSSNSINASSVTNGSNLININEASINELLSLPGIGESKANDIIKYRDDNGFKNIEDIQNVSGIGPLVFEKIKNFITV